MPAPSELDHGIRQIHERLLAADEVVFFTGAGASAESGIPTFRDGSNSFWRRFNPEEMATPRGFEQSPRRVQEWYAERWRFVRDSRPNPAHQAIAALEREFPDKRFSVLTQNVDGLHQAAGSRRVLELHGSIHRLRCHAGCGHVAEWSAANEVYGGCPRCEAPRRPDLVWFGEALDADTFRLAEDAALHADVFIAIGTSAVVQPAARLQSLAYKVGAMVVEVNPAESALSAQTTLAMRCTAGVFFEALWRVSKAEIPGDLPSHSFSS